MTRHRWLKKLGGILLVVSLMCSMAVAVPAAGDDLLQAGSWTEDWKLTPSVENGATLTEADGAAVITVTEGSAVLSKQTHNSLYRKPMLLSFTAKVEALEIGSSAYIKVERTDVSTDTQQCKSAPITMTEWKTIEIYFFPATTGKMRVDITLEGTGKLYVKDILCKEYAGDNLIPYGNGENTEQKILESKTFGGGSFANSTETAYKGLASYKLTKNGRIVEIPVEIGSTYLLEFAFYYSSSVKPRAQVRWNNPDNQTIAQTILFEAAKAGEWTTYGVYLTIPATCENKTSNGTVTEATEDITLTLRTENDTQNVFYDEISFRKIDAGLMDSDRNAVFTPASGETVTAFTTVEAGKSGTAIVALYKKNGETRTLIGVESAPIVAAEAMQAATATYTLPETMEAGEYDITVFAWDMANGLSSLKDAYTHTWTVQ